MKNKDLAPERWDRMRGLLKEKGTIRLQELCETLDVSAATVRRDLEALERQGELRRVHGGAISAQARVEELRFDEKAQQAAHEKGLIAREALKYVDTDDVLYCDGGSTVLELVRLLRDRRDITIVTNSLRAVEELNGDGPRLILIGGEVRQLSHTVVGPLTRVMFQELSFDKAFMSPMGLNLDKGMTTTDPGEAFAKELAMDRAREILMLVDSTKIGKAGLARAGELEQVDVLISDEGMDEKFAQALGKKGITVVRVTTDANGK
jgi:DeoR family fructose operon transcriptional repressor